VSPAPYGRLAGIAPRRSTVGVSQTVNVPIAATYPGFVRGGLLTLVDAADPLSYPGTGTTWFDVSGNGRNFDLQSGPTWTPSDGGYITFSGSNQAVLAYDAGLNASTWTIAIWVYLLSNPANLDTIVSRGYPPTIEYYIDCRTQFQCGAYSDIGANNAANVNGTTSANSTVGSWRLLTGRWDGTNMSIFLDAAREAHANRTWGGQTSTSTFAIAALPVNTGFQRRTDMRVGLCALYGRALSDEEVRGNFEATRWRFER